MKSPGSIFVLAALLLAGIGCGHRSGHVLLPSIVIPVGCASEITLLHCDTGSSPPKCKSVRVKYRSGCERMVVVRGGD